MTAPLLIHFDHLPPMGTIRVRVEGAATGIVVPDRGTAEDVADIISGGNYRIIDGLGPRQRVKQRRLPR